MYGSNFWSVTLKPRVSSRAPMEAAAIPLPSPDTTPPAMKMYFVLMMSSPPFDSTAACRQPAAEKILTPGRRLSATGGRKKKQKSVRTRFLFRGLYFVLWGDFAAEYAAVWRW